MAGKYFINGGANCYTSTDGANFLATTSQARALTSTDGRTHANLGSFIRSSYLGRLYGENGQWLVLGPGGAYSCFLDGGATWATALLSSATLNGAAYGSGRWILGANNAESTRENFGTYFVSDGLAGFA